MTALLIDIIPVIIIAAIASLTRWLLTKAHLRALAEAENNLQHVSLNNLVRTSLDGASAGKMITAEVVMAVDAFTSLRWLLRKFIGGESHSLQRISERTRREAIIRLKREAIAQGASQIIGVRYEYAQLGTVIGRNQHRIALRVSGTTIVN